MNRSSLLLSLLAGAPLVASVATSAAPSHQEEAPSFAELREQASPGPEHEQLARLSGDWEVVGRVPGAPEGQEFLGEGSAEAILGGRFLVVDFTLDGGPLARATRYTLGFDRRHGEYSIVVMDDSGTYFVAARGAEHEGTIAMRGTDDDPVMARMGYEKEFVFELGLEDEDAFTVTLFWVDTRTAEETLLPVAQLSFLRRG